MHGTSFRSLCGKYIVLCMKRLGAFNIKLHMGGKHSKSKKTQKESVWAFDDEDFGLFNFEVEDLERSTAQNHNINSLGLPDDVLAMIASYCSIDDLGRIARVCKTWRRVSYQDAVWFVFLKRMGLEREEGKSLRSVVLSSYVSAVKEDFVFLPKIIENNAPRKYLPNEVRVVVCSEHGKNDAVGKTCLVTQFLHKAFLEECKLLSLLR